MSYYSELKSKSDIIIIAKDLGYNGTKSGNSWQGDCPQHGSSGGKCLVIWPAIQGFRCYHCGQSGDIIKLVSLYKECDHTTAVNFLADRAGMPHLFSGNELSPEEKAKHEADAKEENLVYDMLTAAAEWYHQQLDAIPRQIDRTRSLRDQARQAFELRNQARIDARALMSDRAKALGYGITDPISTWQEMIRHVVEVRGKTGSEVWEYILESSTRSRPSVDAAAGLKR